jgi:hypothetical protein
MAEESGGFLGCDLADGLADGLGGRAEIGGLAFWSLGRVIES